MEVDGLSKGIYPGNSNSVGNLPERPLRESHVTVDIPQGMQMNSDIDLRQENSSKEETTDGNQEQINKMLQEMNKKLNKNTECIFDFHKKTNRVMVKIVDRDTKEVLREIPPEKILDMIAKIWECAGIIIDEKL